MKDSPNVVVAQRIKMAREHLSLSKAELARRVGASRSMVTQWESGVRRPNSENLISLGNALEVAPGWLMRGEGVEGKTGSGLSSAYLHERKPAAGSEGAAPSLDLDALTLAIETLELFLAQHHKKLPPKAKAEAVANLYATMRLWRPEALVADNVTPLLKSLLTG